MADKVAEQKPEETTVEEVVEKVEKPKAVEEVEEKEESKVENGDAKAENGDSKDKEGSKKEESKKEEGSEKNGDEAEKVDKCCIKRKSTSGEAKDTPAEGTTPEKKAKLDEPAEAEVAA